MIDAELDGGQAGFRKEAREWLAAHPPPAELPAATHEAFGARRRWQQQLARAGFVGIDWPREHGGRELGPIERLILDDELARVDAPDIAGLIGVLNIGPAIIAFGTLLQRARYLEPLRTGDEIWCQGMSEPDAGSDLAALRTRARRDGDSFVVDGRKIWCSNADEADMCQLFARSSDEGSKHAGITCLLIDMRSPGIEARPITTIVGGTEFCEVTFDDVRVPASAVLGQVDGGWAVAMHTLMNERLGSLVLQMQARKMLDEIVAMARASSSVDPTTRHAIADVYAQTAVLNTIGIRVLRSLRGGAPGPEGSTVKIFAADLIQRLAELGLTLTGAGAAGPADGIAARWQRRYLEARSVTIAGGTSEIVRNIIGERVLGLPRG